MYIESNMTIKEIAISEYEPEIAIIFPDDISLSQLGIWEPYLRASKKRVCILSKVNKKNVKSAFPVFTQNDGIHADFLANLKSLRIFLYPTNRPNNFNYINK